MKEVLLQSAFWGMALSLLCYEIGVWVRKKVKRTIANPLLIAMLLVLGFLLIFKIDYEIYEASSKYITYFLTPVTVCLAVPLYRQMTLLKTYPKAIFLGIGAGVLTAMVSIFLMSLVFGLNHEQYVTLLPKSVTTAIAIGISEKQGGITAITVTSVVSTGVLGGIIGEYVCKLFKIEEPIARGLAIGTASHAIGTSKAMEMGEVEGAMSSLSIVVAGIMTVIGTMIFAGLL